MKPRTKIKICLRHKLEAVAYAETGARAPMGFLSVNIFFVVVALILTFPASLGQVVKPS